MATKKKTLSARLEELDTITQWFEKDDVDIDLALKKFEEGLVLVKDIKHELQVVENKIVDIKKQYKDVFED